MTTNRALLASSDSEEQSFVRKTQQNQETHRTEEFHAESSIQRSMSNPKDLTCLLFTDSLQTLCEKDVETRNRRNDSSIENPKEISSLAKIHSLEFDVMTIKRQLDTQTTLIGSIHDMVRKGLRRRGQPHDLNTLQDFIQRTICDLKVEITDQEEIKSFIEKVIREEITTNILETLEKEMKDMKNSFQDKFDSIIAILHKGTTKDNRYSGQSSRDLARPTLEGFRNVPSNHSITPEECLFDSFLFKAPPHATDPTQAIKEQKTTNKKRKQTDTIKVKKETSTESKKKKKDEKKKWVHQEVSSSQPDVNIPCEPVFGQRGAALKARKQMSMYKTTYKR